MKTLVLAEKPSVGKDIAKALKCHGGQKGFIEGEKYIITWALGHLVTLADPEFYHEKYKNWNLDDLPIIPEKPGLVVIKESSAQFKTVREQLLRKDVSQIIIGTDAGREGELVARWILEKAGCSKPVKRLWISSVTEKAILEGFKNLKDGKDYIPLFNCAKSRAEADWILGINATRALTAKHNAQLSCGRVQTPTLSIVNKKEEEIRSFVPKDYYMVKFYDGKTEFALENKDGSHRLFDKAAAEAILKEIKGKKAEITMADKKRRAAMENGLYDLTRLQIDASRLYGFSAKQTLNYMQSLYERHKALTYPRTDSQHISNDIVPTIPERLRAIRFGKYKDLVSLVQKGGIKAGKHFVDDKKVSDHHAIIPTEQAVMPSELTDGEMKIYDLVIKRFIAVLLPPFEYDEIMVKTSVSGHVFTARGKNIVNMGFRQAYGGQTADFEAEGEDIKEQIMPAYSLRQTIAVAGEKITSHKTKPPAYFTEGTLLAAMENPGKYSGSKAFAKTLGETGGLGTVATRADIIDKLFSGFMLEKRGSSIYITSKGKQLLKLAPPELKEPDLTAKWEMSLNKIAEGKLGRDIFLGEIKDYTRLIIKEIKQSDASFKHDNLTGKRCPDCGKFLLKVNGKKGEMLVCQDRQCGYRLSVSINSNTRCPNCHKKMTITGEGENKKYNCQCGFGEKVSSFHERLSANRVSQKDVERYLNKLNQEEAPGNSQLAQALKNLKLD